MFNVNRNRSGKVTLAIDVTKAVKAISTAKAATAKGLDKAGQACYNLADKING